MQISKMNWHQVAAYLEKDDRCIVPLGCTEQHAYLSLATDSILAERISIEAAEPENVVVYPTVTYTPSPSFAAFPGTVSISLQTFLALISDIVTALHTNGFRRILLVNGHGGNKSAVVQCQQLMENLSGSSIKVHNWWEARKTIAAAKSIRPDPSHANWFENFSWTRISGAEPPDESKPLVDAGAIDAATPELVKALLKDGSYGGTNWAGQEAMHQLWKTGVEETRAQLRGPWPGIV